MSVLQSQEKEVRYLRRKGLEEESRIVGNSLRDQIRAYGVDCVYYKMNEKSYTDFKAIIDRNAILRHAYGYDINPDYTMSAHMITYAEVQQDIFQLNKFGHVPNVEVDFHFDKVDFACALATKYGQLKEYQVLKTPINAFVPDLSDQQAWPYELNLGGSRPQYTCSILSGWCQAMIDGYEYGKEQTIVCQPYEHTQFDVSFPVNSDLYRSLKHEIECDDYLESQINLTYKVEKADGRNLLSGYLHGSVLFYDIDMLGKYVSLVRPAIGDIVAIDFPDDVNQEKYQITDCYDKQLTQDGISPLLHNYIWKCKAIRYTNAHEENTPQSEADDRLEEMHKYNQVVDEIISKDISMYDEISSGVTEDAVYGGMDGVISSYDVQEPDPVDDFDDVVEYYEDGTEQTLMVFALGSKLFTDGFCLMFKSNDGIVHKLSAKSKYEPNQRKPTGDLRWLKATDSQIVFVNIEGQSSCIACDRSATKGALEICLNSLYDKTLDVGKPLNIDQKFEQCFYKFKETRTYMWSDGKCLYAKLESSPVLYCIAGQQLAPKQ